MKYKQHSDKVDDNDDGAGDADSDVAAGDDDSDVAAGDADSDDNGGDGDNNRGDDNDELMMKMTKMITKMQ